MISGMHHIAILSSKREETLRFYETLGFSVTENHVRPERNDEIIFMKQQNITLEIFISEGHPPRLSGPEAYGLRHIAFAVLNAAAVREELCLKGYAPEEMRSDTFSGKNMFFIKDPDGLPVEIHE